MEDMRGASRNFYSPSSLSQTSDPHVLNLLDKFVIVKDCLIKTRIMNQVGRESRVSGRGGAITVQTHILGPWCPHRECFKVGLLNTIKYY